MSETDQKIALMESELKQQQITMRIIIVINVVTYFWILSLTLKMNAIIGCIGSIVGILSRLIL